MSELLTNQLYAFLIYSFCGVLIGVFFDIFRILRRSFKTNDIITSIEDILFWIFTGIFLIYIIFEFNNGEIRNYIFIGLGFGILIYLLIFSKYFIQINVTLLNIIKKIVIKFYQIFLKPLITLLKFLINKLREFCKFIFKILQKVTHIVIINVRKGKKNKNIQKK